MLQEGDDDELEELDEFPLSSSSEVILHEKDGELEYSLWLLELLWVLWGGSELDAFTESV